MKDARVQLEGPYNVDGTTDNAQTVDLYTTDDFRVTSITDTNDNSIPTEDSDGRILTPITGRREFRLSGNAVPLRVFKGSNESDIEKSLRRWLLSIEALTLPEQGLGYALYDDVRNQDSVPKPDNESGFLIEESRWSLDSQDINRASWRVEGKLSEGVQDPELTPEEYIDERLSGPDINVDEVSSASGSVKLTEVDSRRVTRFINLNAVDIMHNTDLPITGFFDSGVEEEVRFNGTVVDKDEDSLAEKAKLIDQELQGEEATLSDSFMNREYVGSISNSNTTFNEQQPNAFEFRITLEVGNTII